MKIIFENHFSYSFMNSYLYREDTVNIFLSQNNSTCMQSSLVTWSNNSVDWIATTSVCYINDNITGDPEIMKSSVFFPYLCSNFRLFDPVFFFEKLVIQFFTKMVVFIISNNFPRFVTSDIVDWSKTSNFQIQHFFYSSS